jgi:hypothetical protein
MLQGEVPYRDFYKIQTPGILFINAALFKLFGTSLFTAMAAVFIFKTFTIAIVFICARSVSDWKLALIAALLTLMWVAPGGPFRSAPIQFEMLFCVSAIWFTLRWMAERRLVDIFLAGLGVGLVAAEATLIGRTHRCPIGWGYLMPAYRDVRRGGTASIWHHVNLRTSSSGLNRPG